MNIPHQTVLITLGVKSNLKVKCVSAKNQLNSKTKLNIIKKNLNFFRKFIEYFVILALALTLESLADNLVTADKDCLLSIYFLLDYIRSLGITQCDVIENTYSDRMQK